MLILPIINRNRILNVSISYKEATKIRVDVELEDTLPSDIIVSGKSFNSSAFYDSKDKTNIVEFIRNNSILYRRSVLVTTKSRRDSCNYDVYDVGVAPRKISMATDMLYIRAILDLEKELPGVVRGKYISFEELGFGEVFSDDKISRLKRIVTSNPTSRWEMLFKENNLMDMIETLAFLKNFDCIVVSEASVPEETMQQVLASFEKICSRDTKSLNKYYSMAEENRDLYAKMTYVNKLVYGRPLDLIQSKSQKNRQLIKKEENWESKKGA